MSRNVEQLGKTPDFIGFFAQKVVPDAQIPRVLGRVCIWLAFARFKTSVCGAAVPTACNSLIGASCARLIYG